VPFSSANKIQHCLYNTGVGDGVVSEYSGFKDCNITIHTYVWMEKQTKYLHFELTVENDEKSQLSNIKWPSPIESKPCKDGYAVLPIMQGMLLPDSEPNEIHNFMTGRMLSRESSMPWWGQVSQKEGYIAIVETLWDAEYWYYHQYDSGTSVGISWLPSLGTMRYTRKMQLHFYEKCNYVSLCKDFRAYEKALGKLVTLKEKVIKNPLLENMIGTTVIYTPSVYWHCEPESDYYDKENPEKNDFIHSFSWIGQQLKEIKARGIDQAYVHIDGWGQAGYDNKHPDVLPPSPKSGGAEGFSQLLQDMRQMNYIPAVHDQYRDYYVRAESYDEQQAVLMTNGEIDRETMWPGGSQGVLCAMLAPAYVTRNYSKMEEMDILPDGAYLDVFSVIELDECDNPAHRMTRKECMEKRIECFEIIRSKGLIISSEESVSEYVSHLDLVNHGPYSYALMDYYKVEPFGIPVPLFNLVYHDCLLIPWCVDDPVWGIGKDESGFLHGLLNGGLPSVSTTVSDKNIANANFLGRLHKEVGKSEMLSHSFLDTSGKNQQTIFGSGTKVTVDFDRNTYEIVWSDKTMTNGKI